MKIHMREKKHSLFVIFLATVLHPTGMTTPKKTKGCPQTVLMTSLSSSARTSLPLLVQQQQQTKASSFVANSFPTKKNYLTTPRDLIRTKKSKTTHARKGFSDGNHSLSTRQEALQKVQSFFDGSHSLSTRQEAHHQKGPKAKKFIMTRIAQRVPLPQPYLHQKAMLMQLASVIYQLEK